MIFPFHFDVELPDGSDLSGIVDVEVSGPDFDLGDVTYAGPTLDRAMVDRLIREQETGNILCAISEEHAEREGWIRSSRRHYT